MNIKNLTILFIFASILIGAVWACAESSGKCQGELFSNRWDAPDSAVQSILGNRLTELLMEPKKVEMYTVVYRDSAHRNNEQVEADFVLDSLICKLNKEQTATLNFLLISDSLNYKVDTLAVPMIPHRPEYAFKYTVKKDKAIVWYSPGDFTWGIRYDGRDLFWYNADQPSNVNRFCRRVLDK